MVVIDSPDARKNSLQDAAVVAHWSILDTSVSTRGLLRARKPRGMMFPELRFIKKHTTCSDLTLGGFCQLSRTLSRSDSRAARESVKMRPFVRSHALTLTLFVEAIY